MLCEMHHILKCSLIGLIGYVICDYIWYDLMLYISELPSNLPTFRCHLTYFLYLVYNQYIIKHEKQC